jgi:polysaccharide deacetylase 2 family uncharacterized protein YibQ
VNKEIERPLGRDVPPPREPRLRVSAGGALTALCCAAVLAASAVIALRPRPFRVPAEPVAAAPSPAKAAAAPKGEPDMAANARAGHKAEASGPQIIHVSPADQKQSGVITVHDPSAIGQNWRTAHLPDRALIEQSEMGPLPIRSIDGRRPVDVYARPWSGTRGARIAIVIGGLGLSQTGTMEAIEKLPGEVTLAFAPQGNSLGRWMQNARQTGHEIIMQVPFEPFDYPNVNPGRNTLTVEASPAQNLHDLRWALSRITNYTGIMNYMGARFLANAAAVAPVMQELGKRGLLYLDDGTSARSVAPELAMKDGVPFATCDAVIDADHERGAILKKLDQLEATARAKGFAIGAGSAFDVTVDTVASWVQEVKKRGIEVVPISAVVTDPERG